ncbi:AAA family ATPase [Frankia sp. Cj3]|uniref:AAA family ATPase n=1 Tax=Frankia sp. Cj3 TaxID=2880976 RepID=UPI001EF5B6C3|nr:AAA family ATPase [Frankia sp. Cj3]
MARLILMRGLPASGKSTAARQEQARIREAGLYGLVVSRDAIRDMLGCDWAGGRESEDVVTAVQTAAVRAALRAGVDAVVDDTNLPYVRHGELVDPIDRWLDVAHECGATVLVSDMSNAADVEECIRRDALRPLPVPGGPIYGCQVGEAVIRRMAENL